MSLQTDIFDYIVGLMNIESSPTLQTGKSFAVQFAPGSIDKTFLDNSTIQTMSLLVLGKDTDQKALANKMFEVCDNVSFKQNKDLHLHNVEVATPPSFVYFENGFYTWSCIINIKFTKGD